MEIRINISNKKVLEILSKIAKKDRRIFAQEAILHFHNAILENEDVYSIVYDPTTETIKSRESGNYTEDYKKNKEEFKLGFNEDNKELNTSIIDIDFKFDFDEYNEDDTKGTLF